VNKTILITGANAGLGKEAARQLASKSECQKIYLACRNPKKAEAAKADLEKSTNKKIFEILIMDVSNVESVRTAVGKLKEPIDALIMNAGGLAGKTPEKLTDSGMNELAAVNVIGHVVLVDELLKNDKLKKVALLVSSEAARGLGKMLKAPNLKTSSVDEFASILDGSYFGNKFDLMLAYGHVKYTATMWMSSLARKHPTIKFISMSPGSTKGTAIAQELPIISKIMLEYIMMPIVMPLMGMIQSLDKGAKRYVDGITEDSFKTGVFYASREDKAIGEVVDQSTILPDLSNTVYQDNANEAIHKFIKP
jgi:NAD(P)-dependent dehydrogenase (short-subunit alcohol dehydrogenase family)